MNATGCLQSPKLVVPLLVLAATSWWPAPLRAQFELDQDPIDYFDSTVNDPVARLQARLDAGEVELSYDERHGYLPALLQELGVSPSSQGLVFSKTSFQLRRISPRTPRAIYFADDVYVGSVERGDVIEITAVEPSQGAIFYTLRQEKSDSPKFERRDHECLQCHSSTLTRGVPGHLVRSVYAASDGQPVLRMGTSLTDPTSPLRERWGGWYVTGRHGSQRHLGNLVVRGEVEPEDVDLDAGANVTDLSDRIATSAYLEEHSDIVALMVLEHQTQLHNWITRASYLTRVALRDEKVMLQMLERPAGERLESTTRRIRNAIEPLLKALLFSGEARLTAKIEGTSGFTGEFASRGPRDSLGRSLRDFDLRRRLFRHPCSYLIYSEAFDALPAPALQEIYRQLWEILRGEAGGDDFRHLSRADRRAILEILCETKKGLPEYFVAPRPQPKVQEL